MPPQVALYGLVVREKGPKVVGVPHTIPFCFYAHEGPFSSCRRYQMWCFTSYCSRPLVGVMAILQCQDRGDRGYNSESPRRYASIILIRTDPRSRDYNMRIRQLMSFE